MQRDFICRTKDFVINLHFDDNILIIPDNLIYSKEKRGITILTDHKNTPTYTIHANMDIVRIRSFFFAAHFLAKRINKTLDPYSGYLLNAIFIFDFLHDSYMHIVERMITESKPENNG